MLYQKTRRPPWWQRAAYYLGYAVGLLPWLAWIAVRVAGLLAAAAVLAVLGVAAIRVDEAFFLPFFLLLGVCVAAVVEACRRRTQRDYAKRHHPAYTPGRIRRDPQTGGLHVPVTAEHWAAWEAVEAAKLPGIPAQRKPVEAGDF